MNKEILVVDSAWNLKDESQSFSQMIQIFLLEWLLGHSNNEREKIVHEIFFEGDQKDFLTLK